MRRLLASLAPLLMTAAASAAELAPRYEIDPSRSELSWDLPATLHTVHGKVPKLSGTVTREGAVRVRIAVGAAAMATGNDKRDATMRERVLETAKHPEIVFESSSVEGDLEKLASGQPITARVKGTLTVRGKGIPVEVPVKAALQGSNVFLIGSFPLAWKQFGLWDPSFGIVKVREPLTVRFRLFAKPAS